MPTIELTDGEAQVLRYAVGAMSTDGHYDMADQGMVGKTIKRITAKLPPLPLVAGDIVRSNGDKSIVGTVLGVKGGYVCFETDSSVGYGNPFRIMLAELLERV